MLTAAPPIKRYAAFGPSRSAFGGSCTALTVSHDELDLAPFKVKVKTGGVAAGAQWPALGRQPPRPRFPQGGGSASAIPAIRTKYWAMFRTILRDAVRPN